MNKSLLKNMLLTAASILMIISCSSVDKNIIYVNAQNPDGGDGLSWPTAFNSLQDGLDKAQKGKELWVAAGTYIPSDTVGGTNERNKTFQLKNGVALYGGFKGNESNVNQRDWRANKTILSGDLNGDDQGFENNSENSFHVVIGNGTDSTALLDGFIITAGNANAESWPDDGGGGMSNFDGSPTIKNSLFKGNAAFADGGGMRNWGNTRPLISHCIFTENMAAQEGGGMMNGPGSKPVVTNCVFKENSTGEDGGGMYVNESFPLVVNCVFTNNQANLTGGGMYTVNGSRPKVINCTFSRNKALKAGGSLSNLRGKPLLINCILWANSAPANPEIHNVDSDPELMNSIISGSYKGKGNLDSDPLLTEELHLSVGSPAVDAGDNKVIPADVVNDLAGKSRIYNDVVDIGAYEFQK
jgi:parallel beta-helix repeat protein